MRVDEATREKLYAAEKNVAVVRAAVIGLNIAVYFMLMDRAGTILPLAVAISVVAGLYAVFVLVVRPYRRYPVLMTSYFTAITDGALITLWILATGSVDSPFYVLWYVSIVAVAFRYTPRTTMVVSVLYAVAYNGLLFSRGELFAHPDLAVVRTAYIFFVAAVGGLLTQEALEQTQAKVEMRRLVRQARLAEGRFRGLLEAAPDAIVITDHGGHISLVNTRAEHVFGYAREELLGRPVEMLLPDVAGAVAAPDVAPPGGEPGRTGAGQPGFDGATVRETLTARAEAVLDDTFGAGHGRAGPAPQRTGRRKDGGEFPVELSVSPMETRRGPIMTYIIRDITDRRLGEEKLADRARELSRSNAELEQFAYVASHDLQEPLRMVSSYVQLLERRYRDELDDQAREFIGYATEGATRMHHLINDLLAFSRVGTHAQELEPTDVNVVLKAVLRTLGPTIEEAGAELTVPDELPLVLADAPQLAQVFQNLVSNAIKFRGEDPPRVDITVEQQGSEWVFAVRDNGIGIDPRFVDKIFVLFQRLHTRTQYPGTGIGLAICKKVIERHGGRIWAESRGDGHGVVMRFTLPSVPEEVRRAHRAGMRAGGEEHAEHAQHAERAAGDGAGGNVRPVAGERRRGDEGNDGDAPTDPILRRALDLI